MNLNRTVFFLLLLLPCTWACQGKKLVRSSWACYTTRQPGNIPVEIEGGPPVNPGPDTIYTLYLDMKQVDIYWDSAWTRSGAYSITAANKKQEEVLAGRDKQLQQPVIFKAGRGGNLWQLYLQRAVKTPGKPELPPGQLLLKVKYKGRIIRIQVSKLTELDALPSV